MSDEVDPAPTHPEPVIRKHPLWLRLLLVLGILLLGLAAMKGLAALRKAPPLANDEPVVFRAEAMKVARQDVPTWIRGFGTARPHRTSKVTAEVSGQVMEVHEALETGRLVEQGEVLVRLDPRDYDLAVEQGEAEVLRLESELARLGQEEENDHRRLELARRLLEIAEREFRRSENLVREGGVETLSALDARESEVTARRHGLAEVENALALIPARRSQLEAQLAAARSRLSGERLNRERTAIRAPFTGRIVEKGVEQGQKVLAGNHVLTLADDRVLEVPAPLDGRDVARWLHMESDPRSPHWVRPAEERPVRVRWLEGEADVWHEGALDRVERYDEASRTFHVVIAVEASQGIAQGPAFFPLTSGMFCEVAIPGRVAEGVVPIPRSAIDSDGHVHLDRDGRLATRAVEVVRYQADTALVSSGLETGDLLILNRPVRVVDGMHVESFVGESHERIASFP